MVQEQTQRVDRVSKAELPNNDNSIKNKWD